MHLYDVQDMTGALGKIRAGLDERRALTIYYSPQLAFSLRLLLVLGLLGEERADDALMEAQDICPIIRDPSRWPGVHRRKLPAPSLMHATIRSATSPAATRT